MSIAHQEPAAETKAAMQVSSYDKVSSLLMALIIFVGFFVILMFLIWLTMVIQWD